jgi:hypothetical protein
MRGAIRSRTDQVGASAPVEPTVRHDQKQLRPRPTSRGRHPSVDCEGRLNFHGEAEVVGSKGVYASRQKGCGVGGGMETLAAFRYARIASVIPCGFANSAARASSWNRFERRITSNAANGVDVDARSARRESMTCRALEESPALAAVDAASRELEAFS